MKSSSHRSCGSRKKAPDSEGPMWASAPTNIHEKSTNFEGGQSRPPLQRVLKTRRVRRKLLRLPFCVVGVDAHIDPFRRQNGNTPVGGGRTLWYRVSISHRRGGRPCPPARIVRFYGNPMRIRNILTGRCEHRPLQPTSQSAGFRGRTESSAPTKGIKNKACPAEIAASPVLRRRGRCPHRPIPPPKRKHPRRGG